MADYDIIKAFDCCLNGLCSRCPRFNNWRMDAWTCRYGLMQDALVFMQMQEGRVNALKSAYDSQRAEIKRLEAAAEGE